MHAAREKLASKDVLQALLSLKSVTTMVKKSTDNDGATDSTADTIYRRNEDSDKTTIILSGKVKVVSGRDGFRSEQGESASERCEGCAE